MPNLQTKVFLFRILLAGAGFVALATVLACSGEKEAVFLLEETAAEAASSIAQTEELPAGKEGGETAREDASLQEQTCTVHICGAVNAPGVYELPQDSRVVDAVAAGGGFAPDADPEACNLAQPVTDGCQIYIMTQEESALADRGGRNAGIQETEPDAGTDGTYYEGKRDQGRRVFQNQGPDPGLKTCGRFPVFPQDERKQWRKKFWLWMMKN